MITADITSKILQRILNAEKEYGIRVLYAVESGSRAWGFESPNSDFDVRFIYANPKNWYVDLDIEDKRDVIEYDIVDEIDINGWDVRKALKLFRKSNPAFIEWLHSPIVYVDDGQFAAEARDLLTSVYSPEKGIYHYRSMAKTNYRGYLREGMVPLKKYFYVLRPLLSIQWLEKYRSPAPIEFEKLLALIDKGSGLSQKINQLLDRKRISLEKEMIEAIPLLNQFIESELDRLKGFNIKPDSYSNKTDQLNRLFHSVID